MNHTSQSACEAETACAMRGVLRPIVLAVSHALACLALTACGGGAEKDVGADGSATRGRAHSLAAAATWTTIATEHESFTFSGTRVVRYGAGTRWVQKTVTNSGSCSNAFFGSDPAVGVVKSCQVKTPEPISRTCPPLPAYPDESCTGVPVGTTLSSVTGDFVTSAPGQVVDAMLISGDLVVNHDNVVVTRSRVKGHVENRGRKGLVLRDVDLGADQCPAQRPDFSARLITGGSGYTLIRGHLHHHFEDMIILGGGPSVEIVDSLLHNTCYYEGDHLDTIQMYDPGSVATATVTHSRLDVRPANSSEKGNSAIIWGDTPSAGSRLTVRDSLLAGGNYTLFALDSGAGSGVVIEVTNTRFVRASFLYGACNLGRNIPANHSPTIPYTGTEGIIWINNAYSDGAELASCE